MDQTAPHPETEHPQARRSRVVAFARRHPVVAVLGAATASLIGGLEVATGVLIGAGVLALLRSHGEAVMHAEPSAQSASSVDLRARARAVMQAARGKLEPRGDAHP